MDLESLSALPTEELRNIAAGHGIDLPAFLERSFIIEQILDAVDEERLNEVSGASGSSPAGDSAPESPAAAEQASQKDDTGLPFPLRYNDTAISAMLRDPSWAYIFWDIRDDEQHPAPDFAVNQLYVRVLLLGSPQDPPQNAVSWYEFAVDNDVGEWFVNLPEPGFAYVFELSLGTGQKHLLLARSNVIAPSRVKDASDFIRLPRSTRSLYELAGFYDLVCPPGERGRSGRLTPVEHEAETP